MRPQPVLKKFDLSIFQRLFISHVGLGLLIFAFCGLIYFLSTKNNLEKEIKSDFSHAMERMSIYFDKTYTSKINEDLSFIEDSSVLDNYLNSNKEDAFYIKPMVEDLFLHFTPQAKGIYLSARFIDITGHERIITSCNKRFRNYTDSHHFPDNLFYQNLYKLFRRLKKSGPQTILFEGPFDYAGKSTFLVGISKEDIEVGGIAGAVIFHCDLTDFFNYLENNIFGEENIARAYALNGQKIFPVDKKNNTASQENLDNFYSIDRMIRMGSLNQRFIKIEFKISSQLLNVQMHEAFKNFFYWILVSILPIGLIAFILSRNFSKPLISLIGFMERFAQGDFTVRAKVRTGGEMGLLVNSFNRMAEDLQKITVSEDELRLEVNKRKIIEESLRKAYEDLQKIHEELQQTQIQLMQSEKLVALGHLAAGVAHEINNPMVFIINNMEMLGRYVNDYTELLKMMEDLKHGIEEGDLDKAKVIIKKMEWFEQEIDPEYVINDAAKLLQYNRTGIERVRKIVKDLRTFANEGPDTMDLSNVEDIIDSILGILKDELEYKAEIKKEYGNTPLIKCSVQKITQVFINLLMNAVQAIPEKGLVLIKTYVKDKYVCIEIIDNGTGIKPELLNKIFDPFFTTKPVGQGTGLGLSFSYEIVKQHGGEIKVQSTVWEWTAFTVMLPF